MRSEGNEKVRMQYEHSTLTPQIQRNWNLESLDLRKDRAHGSVCQGQQAKTKRGTRVVMKVSRTGEDDTRMTRTKEQKVLVGPTGLKGLERHGKSKRLTGTFCFGLRLRFLSGKQRTW